MSWVKTIFLGCLGMGLVCLFASPAAAQQDLSTTFLRESWVSTFNNPANLPDRKWHFGLPSAYFSNHTSLISLSELTNFDSGTPTIKVGDIIDQLKEREEVSSDVKINGFYFAFPIKDFQLSVEYGMVLQSNIGFPSDLIKLAALGNGPFVGQTLNLAPDLNVNLYHEFSINLAYSWEKLSIGFRPKFLKGIASAQLANAQLDFTTDEEFYQLSLDSDISLNASSLLTLQDVGILGFDLSSDFFKGPFKVKGNTGFAFDLGLRYKLTEDLTIGASMLNVGKITWDQELVNFKSKSDIGFNGIDFNSIIDGESFDLQNTLDSLEEVFEFQTKEGQEFATKLRRNFIVDAYYKLNKTFDFGLVLYGESLGDVFNSAAAFNARVHAGEILAFGLSYTVRNNTYNNLGANLLLQLGPVQLFGATDNIINIMKPDEVNQFSARVGLGLAFSKKEKSKIPTVLY